MVSIANLLPLFLVGLLGSVHCVGMCGGIVGAMSRPPVPRRPFAVGAIAAGVVRLQFAPSIPTAIDTAHRVAAYNAGRIGSYMVAGAISGGLFGGLQTLTGLMPIQNAAYWVANGMLIVLGLYLMGAWSGLARLETIGQWLWRFLRPLVGRFLPIDSATKAFIVGGVWGWVPCGMVYSVLLTAALSGSAVNGAAMMLAFGLGTLPMLLSLGMAGAALQKWLQKRVVRIVAGMLVLTFGLSGLARAMTSDPPAWLEAICVTPSAWMVQ